MAFCIVAASVGMLHTHFAYGAGAAGGADLAFTPTTDASIKPYAGARQGKLVGLMAGHSAPAVDQYLRLTMAQLPAYAENEVVPVVDNNLGDFTVHNKVLWPLGGMNMVVNSDMVLTGISTGSDMFNAGVVVQYGKVCMAPARPVGRIIRRYGTVSPGAAVWTDSSAAITDLDPAKMYGVRAMQAIVAAAKQTLGIRLIIAETGAKPGVCPGDEVDFGLWFGQYGAIISGDSDPMVQGFCVESSGKIDWILTLEELGNASGTSVAGYETGTVEQTPAQQGLGSISSFLR